MKNVFLKPYRWAVVFTLLLISCFTYTLLDTFVIPQEITITNSDTAVSSASSGVVSAAEIGTGTSSTDAVITGNTYEDENVKISISTVEKDNTAVYIADIQVSDPSYLKTAFANDVFGRNIKETTSDIAAENGAIFAINGDYYGFRNSGYVLRNGTLYRDTANTRGDTEDLVIDNDGNFSIISERDSAISALDTSDIAQILSFGPALIEDGKITVDSSSEVSQSKTSNPRTAIGQVSALHYIVIVSDGRTSESSGLSLLSLAEIMKEQGCTVAYNLDGGGSSTMYFNGKIVNNPTDGRNMGEREVSDIVYIGY
jgi:exopolysaccharide biosynthesis protein